MYKKYFHTTYISIITQACLQFKHHILSYFLQIGKTVHRSKVMLTVHLGNSSWEVTFCYTTKIPISVYLYGPVTVPTTTFLGN